MEGASVQFSNQSLMDWLSSQGNDRTTLKFGYSNSTIQLMIPRSELKAKLKKVGRVDPQLADILADDDLVFNVSCATMGSLVRYLSIDLSCLGRSKTTASNQLIYPPDFFGNNPPGTGPPPPLSNLLGWESSNISATFASVVASMTKFMRDTARPSTDSSLSIHRGEMQTWVTFI